MYRQPFSCYNIMWSFIYFIIDKKGAMKYSMIMKTLIFLLIMAMNIVAGCGGQQSADKSKLQVAASFYPMAEFAQAVGGDRVQVTCLVPDGAEPHDWEPSPKDLTRLGRAQVFVYNGMVEPWAEQALAALSEKKIVPVEAGSALLERNGKQDPHVWVSPKKAIIEVERISEALCSVDAKNAAAYKANAKAYVEKLAALDKKLAQVAQKAPKRVFVTAHAAFGHLAADYGLRQLSVAGISAEAEPTPGDLQRLIATVKREKVRYVFFETLTDPKIAKLVAQETGAQTAVLDPLEGLDEEDYITVPSDELTEGLPVIYNDISSADSEGLSMDYLDENVYEDGVYEGLGLIEGEVRAIGETIEKGLKIPHIGWNSLVFKKDSRLFKYIKNGDYVYFVHSYHGEECDEYTTSVTEYGGTLTASVEKDNVFGCQFHPEKSGEVGLNILRAFVEI